MVRRQNSAGKGFFSSYSRGAVGWFRGEENHEQTGGSENEWPEVQSWPSSLINFIFRLVCFVTLVLLWINASAQQQFQAQADCLLPGSSCSAGFCSSTAESRRLFNLSCLEKMVHGTSERQAILMLFSLNIWGQQDCLSVNEVGIYPVSLLWFPMKRPLCCLTF